MPEPPERPSEPEPEFAFFPLEDPRERRPEVVVLPLQPLHPEPLLSSGQLGLGLFGQGEEESGVSLQRLPGFFALRQLLPGVLADGLQHPVAHGTVRTSPGHHERLVYEGAEKVEDVVLLDAFTRAHRFRRLQSPTPSKHREPPEQRPLGLGEQPVAPVKRRPQGLLPRCCAPARALEHIERDLEPLGDLLDRQCPHPGGGEFYGQGYSVELPAHSNHSPRVLPRQLEVWQPQSGAVNEEPDSFVAHPAFDGGLSIVRQGEGRHHPVDLAGYSQGLTTGGQHPQARTRVQNVVYQPRRCLHEMFAVVHDKEQPLVPQVLHERIGEPLTRPLRDLQGTGHRLGHEPGLVERRESDQPDPVRIGAGEIPGYLQREPRLAGATWTREGQ